MIFFSRKGAKNAKEMQEVKFYLCVFAFFASLREKYLSRHEG
jgi:hypothetical protein